ncbi:ADP-ribosylglycohydrolase family protein, partial [Streptomyces massasporeus]
MDNRQALGSWLSGPRAAAEDAGVDFGYRGQQLGLTEEGPGSIARPGRRLGALAVDWALCTLIAYGLITDGYNQATGNWALAILLVLSVLTVGTIGSTPGKRLFGLGNRMLRLIREGGDWRELAAALFQGQGSWGNGAAMRIAPLGAWYADDPEQATHQAEISAYPTHQHREAVVGAMAVAAAAALAADPAGPPTPEALLDGVVALVPRSAVGAGLRRARDMLDYGDAGTVAAVLGSGRRTSAHDTVPFALWSAARGLGDFEQVFWTTALVGGDVDTTCAIAGGVVAAAATGAPPAEWLRQTEELPDWVPVQTACNGHTVFTAIYSSHETNGRTYM